MDETVRVGITGGAGQIGYALLFRIASGEMFGKKRKMALHLLELESQLHKLVGVKMELEDCAFPLLEEVVVGSDIEKVFDRVDYALMVGAKPRTQGMERKDLLLENAHIFKDAALALNRTGVRVLVVGNPCNTNALVLCHNAPKLPPENIRAMTRLDQNRAVQMISSKIALHVDEVDRVGIWGNHSSTMVVDYHNIRVRKKPLFETFSDMEWLQNTLMPALQTRGAKIIEARGASSAASAANAIIDAIIDWNAADDRFFSAAVYTKKNNPYGIKEGLFFSFLLQKQEIVTGLTFDPFIAEKIRITEKELETEKEMVKNTLS